MCSAHRIAIRRTIVTLAIGLPALLAAGRFVLAQDKQRAPGEPPVVPVAKVVEREVTDFEEFTGHVEAAESVNVASRVTGYLERTSAKEGTDVKKGELLFEIDPRPFQAELNRAEAQLRVAEAKLKQTQIELDRATELLKRSAISREDFDKIQMIVPEAQAGLEVAKATLEVYKLNLSFCKITAPIDGRLGRFNLTPGNLVKQDDTVLTTIVSRAPIYIDFEIDERTFLRLKRGAGADQGKPFAADTGYPVFAAAIDETGFPHKGTLSFIGNEFDRSKGTILARASFDNPPLKSGAPLFTPGMFVKVQIPVGQPHKAVLVSNEAISSDSISRFVLVMHDDDTIEERRVQLAQLQENGLRVIADGLKPNDIIVIGGVKLKDPGSKFQRKLVPMPTTESKRS